MTGAAKRWHNWAAAALLAGHAAIAWIARGSPSATSHSDEATYIWLARALRHLSYREIYLVGAPVHAQYPPGFPAFLAALSLPFGEHYDLFIAGIIAVSVSALALLFDVVRRRSGAHIALAVVALSALNPGVLALASKPFSEPLFMFFSFATIWAVARDEKGWVAVAGASAIAAALTRSAGATLVVALFIVWMLERQYRRAAIFVATTAATLGSWFAWTVVAPAKFVGRSYVADAVARPSGAVEPPSMVETLLARVWENAVGYSTRNVPWAMSVPTIGGTVIDNVVAVGVLFAAGGFGLWVLRKKLPLVPAYVVVYAGLLLVWPWDVSRFVIPVVPLLVWALIEGFVAASGRVSVIAPLAAIATVVLLASAVATDVAMVNYARACFRTDARDSAGCFTSTIRGSFDVSVFLRDSTPATSIVVSGNEALLAYQSERVTLSSLALGGRTPTETFALMRRRGAEYVVLTQLREPAPQLVPTMTQGCRELELVREYDATLLLRLPPAGTPAMGTNACEALSRYTSIPNDRR